jgi:hypothetical protein
MRFEKNFSATAARFGSEDVIADERSNDDNQVDPSDMVRDYEGERQENFSRSISSSTVSSLAFFE